MAAGSLADALTGKNLDTAVSTVNTNVSTRLGSIAGIDRGTILNNTGTSAQTATVGSVTTSRAQLSLLGHTEASGAAILGDDWHYIILTNATTITMQATNVPVSSYTVSYELIEFNA